VFSSVAVWRAHGSHVRLTFAIARNRPAWRTVESGKLTTRRRLTTIEPILSASVSESKRGPAATVLALSQRWEDSLENGSESIIGPSTSPSCSPRAGQGRLSWEGPRGKALLQPILELGVRTLSLSPAWLQLLDLMFSRLCSNLSRPLCWSGIGLHVLAGVEPGLGRGALLLGAWLP
jgi:hypothetical protein